MKKILVGFLALASVSAFAQKHMVQLSGYEDARTSSMNRSLDLYNTSGGTAHNTTTSIALNYAYAFTNSFQLGAEYRSFKSEGAAKAETENMRYGIFGIWNFAGRLTDTTYVGLKYTMGDSEVTDATGAKSEADNMTLSAELGHRFTLGTLWGMTYNWSPSLELGVVGIDPKKGDESSQTEFKLNVLKVDVLF